jgi:hypothetical protein
MNVLALDLGTMTGWAYWNGNRAESGTVDFSIQRGESVGMRFLKFNQWLAAHFAPPLAQTELIAYEAAHHRGGAATQILAGFETRVHEFCALHGLHHVSVHTSTLKKWSTGKGNASKEQMQIECASRWGCGLLDDNEADARMVLAWALDRYLLKGKEGSAPSATVPAPGSDSGASTS